MRAFTLFIFSLFLLAAAAVQSGCSFSSSLPSGNVALVEVKGLILEPDDVIADLEKARKSRGIKAVVVRVDSPGGSVGASQEIFRAIRNLDKKKPVVASMGDVAASGGYYIAAGARRIYANEGTVTGSIGVRMEHVGVGKLMELIRLEPETLKSGEFKDIGSPYRPMRPEERKILEDLLAELHEQFKGDIAAARGIDKTVIDGIADGRVYTGLKAKELGLADEIGGLLDAAKGAALDAGVAGEPKMVRMRAKRPWWYDALSDASSALAGLVKNGVREYIMYK